MANLDFQRYKRLLINHREALARDVDQLAANACNDPGATPSDFVDLCSDGFDTELDLCLLESGDRVLAEVNAALARIEAGRFGICEDCGCTIGKQRLNAIPYARLCLSCQARQEPTEKQWYSLGRNPLLPRYRSD